MADFERLNLGLNQTINTKRKYAIDGDESKILEIDLQDMAIMSRIKPAMERINRIKSNWQDLQDIDPENMSDEETEKLEAAYDKSEREIREAIDYLFDANVCEVLLGDMSAFTPVDGRLKYDIVISALSEQYESRIKKEMSKFDVGKVNKKVQKFIGKK